MKRLHGLKTMALGCILVMLVTSGCGRKGPLYIPPPPDQFVGQFISHSHSSRPDQFVAQLPTL